MSLSRTHSQYMSGRSPQGERGLKSNRIVRPNRPGRRRSPQGERGLKYVTAAGVLAMVGMEPSAREGGIEIVEEGHNAASQAVALRKESVD